MLSAEVGGKHGFSVSGLVFDEIHTQPNRQLYDVLTKGSSDARQNPLHFIITTAGNDRHSIAYELHTKAVDILEGRRVDPTFYPVVYGLKDDEDWEDEANWYKVNPSLGYTVDIERLRDAYREAKQNPADEITFKWLRCNMWVSSTVAWIPDAIYMRGNEPIDMDALAGRDCYAGLDLSSTGDITALVLIFPPRDEFVEICKKVGKSELAAAVALYLLYADNEPSAEVYGAAADRQQASIVFDVAKQMVEMSPALMKRSKLMGATKRIVNYSNAVTIRCCRLRLVVSMDFR